MNIEVIASITNEQTFIKLFDNYHHRFPNGTACHYCPNSSFIPIDSDCKEFQNCSCVRD